MKIKILPLIGFLIGLALAIISLLALFGDSTSLSIFVWVKQKLALLLFFSIGCLITYYLSPFVINLTDEE